MADLAEMSPARLIDLWSRITVDSDTDRADPVVEECARRLAADPGGRQAFLWVYGLIRMGAYVIGRQGAPVERAVLDALVAAAGAADGDGERCGHESHPYEKDLAEWEGDAESLSAPDPVPLLTRPDALLCCPWTVSGYARIAADVIAPGRVRGIPAVVPEYDADRIHQLDCTLNDYPSNDPLWELELYTSPDTRRTRASRASYVVLANACCWYIGSGRIRVRSLADRMIEGLEEVLPELGDGTCAHADGAHPDFRSSADVQGAAGVLLRSPGGRAQLREDYEDEDGEDSWYEAYGFELNALICPAYLRTLAHETIAHLRTQRDSLFGHRETGYLDAVYLDAEGNLEPAVLGKALEPFKDENASAEAALWAARRYADPRSQDRDTLLRLTAEAAGKLDLPYSVARDVLAILRSAADTSPATDLLVLQGIAQLEECFEDQLRYEAEGGGS
ncbi:hypothetical protein [Streptomyces sp. NPDC050738]|uniref:hypothetical protein n=1 Tax=Streptomyces sp. NPDC050738 TaxID=3154744 RepID=UPI00344767C4